MKIAFLFAGQGAQAVGMGKDFYDNYESSKEIFDQFPEIRDICFNGPEDILNQTKYAQKCMLLTSYVYASKLKDAGILPNYSCGLSLGEYTALTFAGTWNLNEAIDIVSFRGDIMQNALPLGTTKMAAVIGLDRDKILSAIKDIDGVCEIANYNCPGQIVITGDNKGVDEGMKRLEAAGALKVVALNVSGAFHSSLLKDASNKLREVLDKYQPKKPDNTIIYNVSGTPLDDNINDILQKQICNSVYFEDTLKYLIEQGVDTFVEIGPGKTLSGFLKRIDRKLKCYVINDAQSLEDTISQIKGNNAN